MSQNIDFSLIGDCFAAIPTGRTVQFWCHSLDGGSTDSRFVTLTFKDEATAAAIASLTSMETPSYAREYTYSNHNSDDVF
jgi:hypothetical protein